MTFFKFGLSVESFSIYVIGLSPLCHGQRHHMFTGYTVWRCAHSFTLQNSHPNQKDTNCIINLMTHTIKSGFLFIWTLNNWLDPRCNNCLQREKKLQFPLSVSRAGNNKRQLKKVNRVMEQFTFCSAYEFLNFCLAFKHASLVLGKEGRKP